MIKKKLALIAAGLAVVGGASVAPSVSITPVQAEGTSSVSIGFGTSSDVQAARHCGIKLVKARWTPACVNLWPGGYVVPKYCNDHYVPDCR